MTHEGSLGAFCVVTQSFGEESGHDLILALFVLVDVCDVHEWCFFNTLSGVVVNFKISKLCRAVWIRLRTHYSLETMCALGTDLRTGSSSFWSIALNLKFNGNRRSPSPRCPAPLRAQCEPCLSEVYVQADNKVMWQHVARWFVFEHESDEVCVDRGGGDVPDPEECTGPRFPSAYRLRQLNTMIDGCPFFIMFLKKKFFQPFIINPSFNGGLSQARI